MGFFDLLDPYSPEKMEVLEDYLKEHDGFSVDNLFEGPEYFFIIKERDGLIH